MDNKENDISVHALVLSTAVVSLCVGWLAHAVITSGFELASAVAEHKK